MRPEYLMVIDVLPSSKLDIVRHMSKNGFNVYRDIHKENKHRIKCVHDVFCPIFNELVMMKDFRRDDELSVKFKLDILEDKLFVFENSHISNLVYCKMSNKSLFKSYMKEFKKRRINWHYSAIVLKKNGMAKNSREESILRELMLVLRQCRIDYTVINKWNSVVDLRADIANKINDINKKTAQALVVN